jgi:hypothetical protein
LCQQAVDYRVRTVRAFEQLADAPGIAPAVRDTLLRLIDEEQHNIVRTRKACAERARQERS